MRYVAFLRGINVGGKNMIPMPALKAAFESSGFDDVSTYIQSGNVLFTATGKRDVLARRIEALLQESFALPILVVVRSRDQMIRVVANAPKGFGADPGRFRYDAIFLREPLTAREAMKVVSIKEGVDQATPGAGVIYFSRLIAKLTQSRVNKIVGTPTYKQMTIRNWNTTTKITNLLKA